MVWWGVLRLKWINREEEIDGCSCDSGSDKQEEEKRREKKNIIIIIIPRSVARAFILPERRNEMSAAEKLKTLGALVVAAANPSLIIQHILDGTTSGNMSNLSIKPTPSSKS